MTTQPTPGAMTGLRVIDLTRVLGGPYCTQILADHVSAVIGKDLRTIRSAEHARQIDDAESGHGAGGRLSGHGMLLAKLAGRILKALSIRDASSQIPGRSQTSGIFR